MPGLISLKPNKCYSQGAAWLILLALLSLPVAAQTEDPSRPPEWWLGRLVSSFENLSYRGIFTYEYGNHLESLRITHGRVDGQEYERLEHLDGKRREIIRRGQQLTCQHPGNRLIRLYQKRLAMRAGLQEVEQSYSLKLDGEERVAGRSGVIIAIQPRDEYRYGYRLTLDSETGLLLRSELLSRDDGVLERFKFAAIDVGVELDPSWIAPPAGEPQSQVTTVDLDQSHKPQWGPGWLPPGFSLALPVAQGGDEVQTFSDGLAVISIFLEPADGISLSRDGVARRGATIAYARRVELNGKPFMVTVLGEVPRVTARQVAKSIAWQGDRS